MADILLLFMIAYGTVGVVFAVAFVTVGVRRVDGAASHATWGFRVIIFPASTALWPLLAVKWLRHPSTEARP